MLNTASKVQIAYIHGENVSHSFHHSIMRLANSPDSHHRFTPTHISALSGALDIPDSRNALMEYFLDKTDATHIWWIDTDMGFAADTVDNLLQAEKDVIGAVCKGLDKVEADGYGGYVTKEFVTAYELAKYQTEIDNEPKDFLAFTLKQDLDLSVSQPIQVGATGTACLLVSRHAANLVRSMYGPSWFDRVAMPTASPASKPYIIGEDLSFCYRLATVGIPVFIHPKVRTTHAKTVWLQ